MKLHEFHIGDRRPRPVGHRHAVARGDVGIAGVEIHLARPPGGQQGDRGEESMDRQGIRIQYVGAETAIALGSPGPMSGQEIDRTMVLEKCDSGMGGGAVQQGLLDFAARGIPMVENPALGMPAFPGEVITEFRFSGPFAAVE